MRQSKKLWRRVAALTCSFALLMGSSLQAMPMTAFSATEDTTVADGETSKSEDSGAVDDGNSDVVQMVTLTGSVQDTNGEAVNGVTVQLGTLENDSFVQDEEVNPVRVENGAFSIEISEDKLNSCTYFNFSDEAGTYVSWDEPIDVDDSYVQKEIIYIPKAENTVSFSLERAQVTVSVYNPDSNEYEAVDSTATVAYDQPVQFKIEAADAHYKVNGVTADGKSISSTSEEEGIYVIDNIQKNTDVQISLNELEDPSISVEPSIDNEKWVQENSVQITELNLPTSDSDPSAELFYLFSKSEIPDITSKALEVKGKNVGKGSTTKELNALLTGYLIEENGYAYLCIKDNNGLYSDVASVHFTNIDTTAPEVIINAVSIVNDNSADGAMATVNVTASDGESGVEGVYYKLNHARCM